MVLSVSDYRVDVLVHSKGKAMGRLVTALLCAEMKFKYYYVYSR